MRRSLRRQRRERSGLPVVSIVGYTNAGKSTLLNVLTQSEVLVEDQLFATLDATTRRVELDERRRFLLTDTVGFIRRLPHHLVESFRATLQEVADADLLLYPTAIGWDPADSADEQQRQLDAWQTIQRGHAIANGIPVLVCNRTGHETDTGGQGAGIRFWGNSFIAGPQGELLAQAAADRPELLVARLDMRRGEQVRRIWPYLRDRRIDAYQDLLLRFRDQHH